MRSIFNRSKADKEKEDLFSKKTYILKRVQKEFSLDVRNKVMGINDRLDQAINKFESTIDDETSEFIYSELSSNLMELELNINTIIMNFSRITGVTMRFNEGEIEKKTSLLKRGQIFFLLNGDASEVYGQTLIYLEEEIKSELSSLSIDLDNLIALFHSGGKALETAITINQEYFKINSDLNTIIDDINTAIDSLYGNISGNRDMNINLSFLLISAFLSVILFFPEFNNMLNLQNEEITYEDKLDEIIYEKLMDETSLEDLIDIRSSNDDNDSVLDGIQDEMLKEIIKDNVEWENQKLETEKNRIKVFINILLVILVPFLIWIVFIVL